MSADEARIIQMMILVGLVAINANLERIFGVGHRDESQQNFESLRAVRRCRRAIALVVWGMLAVTVFVL